MAARPRVEQTDTRSAILDAAEALVQSRGFNGFSYGDVSVELGITTAALHYHFPGKAELGQALISRYATRFGEALAEIELEDSSALDKLYAYADLYLAVLRGERMCLCGMLAAEYQTLPAPMRDRVVAFFDDNYAWLSRILKGGRAQGSLKFTGSPEDAAQMIVGTLEGAMLVARPYGDAERFKAVQKRLIGEFANPASSSRRRR